MSRVIIIGGGPSGSALGCYLSMQGIENTIIEADLHPRPHVGESLVTSTTRVFEDIGFLETMERERFPKKWGAAWHPYTNRKEYALRFAEIEQEGIEQDYTYHVDRSRFDMLLLKHARSLGSTVHQGVDVTRICFEGDRAVGVLARVAGRNVEIEADIVVDASGRRALLGRQLGIYERDPLFNQHAVHGWFENVNRGEGDSANYIHIYFLPVERGWAWQIPINERITSVGVVTEGSVFRDSKGDVEGFFRRHVESNPALADALQPATRVNDLKREGDYSYSMKSFCGNGWLLVGDAARFVDPIFSSGVSVALYSARFASEVISTAVERNDFSAPSFQAYENRLRGGVAVWYDFIKLYYKLLPLFTHFIQDPVHRAGLLELLQGEVYDRSDVPPVLESMRSYIRDVEANESHVLHPNLSSIPIDEAGSATLRLDQGAIEEQGRRRTG